MSGKFLYTWFDTTQVWLDTTQLNLQNLDFGMIPSILKTDDLAKLSLLYLKTLKGRIKNINFSLFENINLISTTYFTKERLKKTEEENNSGEFHKGPTPLPP